jgi:hypothetical protein
MSAIPSTVLEEVEEDFSLQKIGIKPYILVVNDNYPLLCMLIDMLEDHFDV